jgi:predicted transcriptional regulator
MKQKAKRALLLSIRQRFAKLIFAGTKVVELRRVHPKIGPGDLVFVYVPAPVMAVQGAFEVEQIVADSPGSIWGRFGAQTGLTKAEFDAYYKDKKTACAITIRRCWKLKKPVRLAELKKDSEGFRPPQSYHYKCPDAFSRSIGFRQPKKPRLVVD